jgi:hypothetical protein
MAKKHAPDAMVDGMFMGASLLKKILDAIVAHGGHREQLHYLTSDRAAETISSIGKLIAEAPWKIPSSLMEMLAYDQSVHQFGPKHAAYDRFHHWSLVTHKLGIESALTFRGHEADNECCKYEPLPEEILEQLQRMSFESKPLVVQWQQNEHVIVSLTVDGKTDRESGSYPLDQPVLETGATVAHLSIVPAIYFDLTR